MGRWQTSTEFPPEEPFGSVPEPKPNGIDSRLERKFDELTQPRLRDDQRDNIAQKILELEAVRQEQYRQTGQQG